MNDDKIGYRKDASSNTTFFLEAHARFFRLLMKGIFDPYVITLISLITVEVGINMEGIQKLQNQ
jgi:hypothetical protein